MQILKKISLPKFAEAYYISQLSTARSAKVLLLENIEQIDVYAELFEFFAPNAEIVKFPSWDCLPYDRISPSINISSQRLHALAQLIKPCKNLIILTTAQALIQKVPPKAVIEGSILNLKTNDLIGHNYISEILIQNGFSRSINAMHPGEFAVRGSIVDVVINEGQFGYRLDFFGNRLESIRKFNVESQTSLEKTEELVITPSSEILINDNTIKQFLDNFRQKFGLAEDPILEAIAQKHKYAGMEHFMSLFYPKLNSLLDYIPTDSIFAISKDFHQELDNFLSQIYEQYDRRRNFILEKNYKALPPEELYLTKDQLFNNLKNIELIELSPFNSSTSESFCKPMPSLYLEAKSKDMPSISGLKIYLKEQSATHVAICCFSEGSRSRLHGMLSDYEIPVQLLKSYSELTKLPKNILGLLVLPIEQGFFDNNLCLISEQDLLGERLARKQRQHKFKSNILGEINTFSEGDIVVHIEHGIGRFEGLETLKVGNSIHDFAKLAYHGSDKFYLPVENIELISKYGSNEDIELDKLGSANWQIRKAKLKNRIKIAAEALLKTAAERALKTTDALIYDADLYKEFCNKFPYVETDDQLRAIVDIFEDFAKERAMDRLICGDVGFGKTEVALRAAFIAASADFGGQVAVLVPTTLLARQHYKTFTERFAGFPIRIRQLSKFTPRSDIKLIKDGVANGDIDIIIGTHALLAKDIRFKELSLLIIDEEQHFGVGQKEKLKELKNNCHVLTLSATPIPRTLQMSLTGIKELSVIATPPVDRLPIKTYVMPYDGITIREAILREYHRGGRIFYVTPRIQFLDAIAERIKELLPEIKAVVAHGQMPAGKLDEIMNDFYDGKYQVLISTTIVESGLDIQQANTIIIDNAQLFGLAQLYQIRGRIGRSNSQAYAYLTYPPHMKLNALTEKKLSILQSLENLGAGFSIASHDMDIRGYGNLVGDEQSGHIKEIGIELYQQMLEDTIKSLKADYEPEIKDDWSPTLNIGISVQIPEAYIPDIPLRLSFYRRIASLTTEEDLQSLAIELIDRFGPIPTESEHLLAIVKLKAIAKTNDIEKIDLGEKGVLITFRNNQPKHIDKVLTFINLSGKDAKLRPDNKLMVLRTWNSPDNILKGIEKILQALA